MMGTIIALVSFAVIFEGITAQGYGRSQYFGDGGGGNYPTGYNEYLSSFNFYPSMNNNGAYGYGRYGNGGYMNGNYGGRGFHHGNYPQQYEHYGHYINPNFYADGGRYVNSGQYAGANAGGQYYSPTNGEILSNQPRFDGAVPQQPDFKHPVETGFSADSPAHVAPSPTSNVGLTSRNSPGTSQELEVPPASTSSDGSTITQSPVNDGIDQSNLPINDGVIRSGAALPSVNDGIDKSGLTSGMDSSTLQPSANLPEETPVANPSNRLASSSDDNESTQKQQTDGPALDPQNPTLIPNPSRR